METKTAPDQIVPDPVIPAKQSSKNLFEGRCSDVADFRNESIAKAGQDRSGWFRIDSYGLDTHQRPVMSAKKAPAFPRLGPFQLLSNVNEPVIVKADASP